MMDKRSCRLFLLTSTILGFASATPALADDAATAAADDGNEIVVNARRVEERLQDVPISITVFNQEQLSNRNVYNAGDLGNYTPSLSTNSRYGPEKSTFAIRGFTQENATSPSVGVYFAEVTAPRAAGGTASGNGAGVGAFFDLASVQVLKGPQGTLFGRNTTGGAILLVPQKPTGQFEGYVEGTLGNYDTRRVQAVLNVPLSDTFRVRLGVDRNKRDGYMKNQSGIGPKSFNDTDYIAARLSIIGELTPNLENYTIFSYSKSESNGPMARIIACNRTSASPFAKAGCAQLDRQTARGDGIRDVENDNPGAKSNLEQWSVINTTTWLASDAITVKNIASYAEFLEQSNINIQGDNFTVPAGFGPISGQPFQMIISRNVPGLHNAAQSTFTEELQVQGKSLDDRLNWQAGGYMELSNPLGASQTLTPVLLNCPDVVKFQCTSYFGPTTGALSSASFHYNFRNLGVYAQGTYKFTDKLSLTAGIRYTSDKVDHTGDNISVKFIDGPNKPRFFCNNLLAFPGTPLPNAPLGLGKEIFAFANRDQCHIRFVTKSSRPTWLIDLDYKPIDDMLLYAKYARGYRQGMANTNAIGFETWGPEKVDTFEVGMKASFDGFVRGYFNVAAFYNKFTDQQIQASATAKLTSGISGANIIVNAGRSTIKGVEVDASVTPFEGLKLDAAYAYLDTKLDELTLPTLDPNSPYATVTSTAQIGGQLAFTPKNRYTLTATYTLPLDPELGKVSLGGTFTHTDSQVSTFATAPQFRRLPPSNLLNLNMNWNSIAGTTFDLALFMTNVTNKAAPVAVSGSYLSFGFESMFYNEPRMYGMRLKYRFGS